MRAFMIVLLLSALLQSSHGQAKVNEEPLPLPPPNHGGIYVIAHRGAHNDAPENSLPAYEKAIRLGCDFVEIDVRTTKDGHFVSIHNSTIDAYVEGATGKVADRTLAELRALDIGARHGPQWTGTRIPTLEEILALCKDRIGIYLDLKDAPIPALAQGLRAHGMVQNTVWYLAPPQRVQDLREACPDCIPMPNPGAERNLAPVIQKYKPQIVAPVWRDFSQTYTETAHQYGVKVFVDEQDETSWKNALAWKADAIQTDHPARLIRWLQDRAR